MNRTHCVALLLHTHFDGFGPTWVIRLLLNLHLELDFIVHISGPHRPFACSHACLLACTSAHTSFDGPQVTNLNMSSTRLLLRRLIIRIQLLRSGRFLQLRRPLQLQPRLFTLRLIRLPIFGTRLSRRRSRRPRTWRTLGKRVC
jgi:hypothetical protein